MTVPDQVVEIVASILRVPPASIDASTSPDTLPVWDSLRHLQIVLALEEAFGLQLSADEIEAMHSVRVIAAIIQERAGQNS